MSYEFRDNPTNSAITDPLLAAVVEDVASTERYIDYLTSNSVSSEAVAHVDPSSLAGLSDLSAAHYDYMQIETLYMYAEGEPVFHTEPETLCLATSVPVWLETQAVEVV